MGIARAFVNMAKGGETQGGSTITQQYVKNAMLDDQSQTISRKFKELFVSIKVGRHGAQGGDHGRLPEHRVLRTWCLRDPGGRPRVLRQGRHGPERERVRLPGRGAQGRHVLRPGGCVGDRPGRPRPRPTRARAEKRWSWILDEEVKDGHLTATERAKYKELPQAPEPAVQRPAGRPDRLPRRPRQGATSSTTGPRSPQEQLQQGGYEIHTTFDKKKVDALEAAVKKVRKENIDPKQPPEDGHLRPVRRGLREPEERRDRGHLRR